MWDILIFIVYKMDKIIIFWLECPIIFELARLYSHLAIQYTKYTKFLWNLL